MSVPNTPPVSQTNRRSYAHNTTEIYYQGNVMQGESLSEATFETDLKLASNMGYSGSFALVGEPITGKDLDQPLHLETEVLSNETELINNLDNLTLNNQSTDCEFIDVTPLVLKPVRSPFNLMPEDQSLLNKAKIPLSLFFTPFSEKTPVPMIDLITRCRYCSAFPQPQSPVSIDGELWRCLLCGFTSKFPENCQEKIKDCWPVIQDNPTVDVLLEPKFIASPFIFFVIDTSYPALKNGMLSSIIFTIKETLPNIPKSIRIGFLTVNSTIQFYSFESPFNCPTMVEMPEIEDPYVPLPSTVLLVPLDQYFEAINQFLDTLESLFENTYSQNNCLGAALKAIALTEDFMAGSVIIFQTSIPDIGHAALVKTGGTSILGTKHESTLLKPKHDYYRSLSLRFSGKYINVDVFSFASQDFDLPTITPLVKYTGGSVYYYPNFKSNSDSNSESKPYSTGDFDTLFADLHNLISHRKAYSVGFRGFVPYGMTIGNISGNMLRNGAATGFSGGMGYGDSIQVEYFFDDRQYLAPNKEGSSANFQGIFTYINHQGDKLARILNYSLPCTSSLHDLLGSVDSVSYTCHLIRDAVECVTKLTLDSTRENLREQTLSFFKTHYQNLTNPKSDIDRLFVPYNSRLIPYIIHAATKHVIFQQGASTPVNDRIFWHLFSSRCSPEILVDMVCSNVLSLSIGDSSYPVLARLNPSSERIARKGIFILDFGRDLWCWVGRNVDSHTLSYFFGIDNYDSLPDGKLSLDSFSQSISRVLKGYYLRRPRFSSGSCKSSFIYLPSMILVKDSDVNLRHNFLSHMFEDKNQFGSSYQQFIMELHASILKTLNLA